MACHVRDSSRVDTLHNEQLAHLCASDPLIGYRRFQADQCHSKPLVCLWLRLKMTQDQECALIVSLRGLSSLYVRVVNNKHTGDSDLRVLPVKFSRY